MWANLSINNISKEGAPDHHGQQDEPHHRGCACQRLRGADEVRPHRRGGAFHRVPV